ncbi:MAG: TrmB family transcriptional regulator [Chromatiaceae bacterium]|jgi:sugar-specific transcriptional regulator TrmB
MSTVRLQQLGFTALETDIYLALLRYGDMTGYAVAKQVGKVVANVYKALESLHQKGAVLQLQQDQKRYAAVPWRQLLDHEQRKFSQTLSELATELESLPAPDAQEGVYQLKNPDQLLYDSRQLCRDAQGLLLADLQPAAVPLLAEELVAAASRGVEVRVKIYEPTELPGVHLTLRANGREVYGKTADVSFKLVADGNNFVIGLLSADLSRVIQAFKSRSALLNMSLFCGLTYELILTELKQSLAQNDLARSQQILADTAHLHPFSTENQVFNQFNQRYSAARLATSSEPDQGEIK